MAGWVTSEQNPFVIFAYGMRFLTALWDQFLPPDRHAIKIHRTEYAIFVRGTCSRKITNGCWQRHLLIVGHLSITVSGLRLQRLCTKSGLIFKSSFCLPRVANLKACGSSRDRGHNHGLSVLALLVVEVVAFIVTLSLSSPLLPFQNYRLDLSYTRHFISGCKLFITGRNDFNLQRFVAWVYSDGHDTVYTIR